MGIVTAEHVLGAERRGGQAAGHRRIDPARKADDRPLETALAHVVAEAQDERFVDRFDRAERRE